MKKIASFFLIVSLFYNVLGFYMMFVEQQKQMWVSDMAKTDVSQFEIIEVRINPYGYVYDSGFESANEDITFKNKSYHVFKKRIQNNVLKFYCLRNLDKQEFHNDLKKVVNSQLFDGDSDKDNPTKKLISTFFKDYIPQHSYAIVTSGKIIYPITLAVSNPKSDLLSGHFSIYYLPPNMA